MNNKLTSGQSSCLNFTLSILIIQLKPSIYLGNHYKLRTETERSTNLHSESIHVCSDRHERRLAGPDITHHTGDSKWVFVGNAHKIKLCSDQLAGLEFFEAELRVLVNSPPNTNHVVVDFWRIGETEEFTWDES